jgi:hypothetical protein
MKGARRDDASGLLLAGQPRSCGRRRPRWSGAACPKGARRSARAVAACSSFSTSATPGLSTPAAGELRRDPWQREFVNGAVAFDRWRRAIFTKISRVVRSTVVSPASLSYTRNRDHLGKQDASNGRCLSVRCNTSNGTRRGHRPGPAPVGRAPDPAAPPRHPPPGQGGAGHRPTRPIAHPVPPGRIAACA